MALARLAKMVPVVLPQPVLIPAAYAQLIININKAAILIIAR